MYVAGKALVHATRGGGVAVTLGGTGEEREACLLRGVKYQQARMLTNADVC